jgi:hypothetical protein
LTFRLSTLHAGSRVLAAVVGSGYRQDPRRVDIRQWSNRPCRYGVAHARYVEVMTIMILLAGIASAIGALSGYVTWRDRRRGGSPTDPSTGHDVRLRAQRRTVRDVHSGGDTFGTVVGVTMVG